MVNKVQSVTHWGIPERKKNPNKDNDPYNNNNNSVVSISNKLCDISSLTYRQLVTPPDVSANIFTMDDGFYKSMIHPFMASVFEIPSNPSYSWRRGNPLNALRDESFPYISCIGGKTLFKKQHIPFVFRNRMFDDRISTT